MINLEEDPLGPSKILRIAGRQFPRPIVTKAQCFNLLDEDCDVFVGCLARMPSGFDCVLFRR